MSSTTPVVMQAITTKYICPTDRKGARIKATNAVGKSLTIGYRHDLSSEAAHRAAAEALASRLDWPGRLVQGAIKGGYVFVFVD